MRIKPKDKCCPPSPELGLITSARLVANSEMSVAEAAQIYAKCGIPVFPCNPKTKAPLVKGGFKVATTDTLQIRAWWERWPNAMIGMPTGSASWVWVFDIDDMPAHVASIEIDLPPTLTAVTGNGEHRYFEWDPSNPVRNAQKTMKGGQACWPLPEFPGADVRGDGGYTILPPSIHPSGRPYRWSKIVPPAAPPTALIRAVTRRDHSATPMRSRATQTASDRKAAAKTPTETLQEECAKVRTAQDGAQESTLNSACLKIGRLVGHGRLPYEDALQGLLQAAKAMPSYDSKHPWIPEKLGTKIAKALDDGAAKARAQLKSASLPSEVECAKAFISQNKDNVRYNCTTNEWMRWSGFHWEKDSKNLVQNQIQNVVHDMSSGNKSCCKSSFIIGVKRLASADPAVTVVQDELDTDRYLLGTPSGTVDLKTGKLRIARPSDLITKVTSTAPKTGAPVNWLSFLDDITCGDRDFQLYLQKLAGYSLTGDVNEHALFFFVGEGQNGKSVYFNVISKIWNDYSRTSAVDTFTASHFARHTTDLAALAGARLVTASESSGHKSWDEALIKQVTGGEPISARLMRQDNFTFTPQFKLFFAGNQPPQLNNVNKATRRRFHMIPFDFTPAQPDRNLEVKLMGESAEILSWAIEGCRLWQKQGLSRPVAVTKATEAYLEDQDVFGEWLKQRCNVDPKAQESSQALWNSWSEFAKVAGEDPGSHKRMSQSLKSRGFTQKRVARTRLYAGISLSNAKGDG